MTETFSATTPLVPTKVPATGRDPRVDVFRGIALVMIFIDHVPENIYSYWTLWSFGWSDAAEGFVLMSGISAGLAYGLFFRRPMRFWTGLARVWRRSWTIYLTHILITVCGMAMTAAVATYYDDFLVMFTNQVGVVMEEPKQFLIGVPLLLQQLDYGDILPMYLVLIFFSPIALMLAWTRPWLLLAGSVLLWFVTAWFHLNLPSWTREQGWFFNPLAWQLIFVVGILTGVALKDGRRFVPVRWWLQVLAGALLLFGIAWMRWPLVNEPLYDWLWWAERHGWPDWLIGFEKTFLPLPRILHALALAYFLSSFDIVRRACTTPWLAPFGLLGRHALPVFALGSIIVYALQTMRTQIGIDVWQDTLLIGGGVAAMFALAAAREYWPKD